jgi:4-amino-4-deoxy-L-arabinose transferase-like glycosyltransferase
MNRWVSWLLAGVFLGLAFLAKGPMHLLFFYGLVLGACWRTKRWKELVSGPHLAGLALCIAVFSAWASPFLQKYGKLIDEQPWLVQTSTKGFDVAPPTEPPLGAFAAWRHELASRVTGEEETSTKDWLIRGPRALVMFLPWVLFVPLWWKKGALQRAFEDDKTRALYRGLCLGVVGSFALMVLIPSSSPRYVAPLLAPVAILLGWLVSRRMLPFPDGVGLRWSALIVAGSALAAAGWVLVGLMWWNPQVRNWITTGSMVAVAAVAAASISHVLLKRRWAQWTAGTRVVVTSLLVVITIGMGLAIEPMFHVRDDIRPTGREITQAMEPKDAPLHVFHLGQVPYVFYLPANSIESYDLQQLPESGVRWMLTTSKVLIDFGPLFERRYGAMTKMGEWTGGWGASDQDINRHMVLLQFAGR